MVRLFLPLTDIVIIAGEPFEGFHNVNCVDRLPSSWRTVHISDATS
jgi:hypothetical protein